MPAKLSRALICFWTLSIIVLRTLACESQENDNPGPTPSTPHAVFGSASRERTASVRRRHGELGVLIKIFYKSACAVQMRDNGAWMGRGVVDP